jgi:hypothetical protein
MIALLTQKELEDRLRKEVENAGGAKKWCRKHNVLMDHALHMIVNGTAATLPNVLDRLGFRAVTRYEPREAVK